MNQVNCPVCGKKCVKSGKTKAGSQRWLCKECKTSLAHKIDNDSKELQLLYFEDMVGSESASAARVRNHRATQKLLKEKEQTALQCNATVTEGNTSEISGSTEIENSEKEEKKPKKEGEPEI